MGTVITTVYEYTKFLSCHAHADGQHDLLKFVMVTLDKFYEIS